MSDAPTEAQQQQPAVEPTPAAAEPTADAQPEEAAAPAEVGQPAGAATTATADPPAESEKDAGAAPGDAEDTAAEEAEGDDNDEEEEEEEEEIPAEPVRPATPQRTVNLRAQLADLEARVAQRNADVAAAKEELANHRSRDEIHADVAAEQKAAKDAQDAAEASKKEAEAADAACVAARAVGARIARFELFAQRVSAWVENELVPQLEAAKRDRALGAERKTLDALLVLKARRDDAMANLADLVDERDRNREALRGAATNAPAHSPSRTGRLNEQQQQSQSQSTHRDPNQPSTARRGVLLSPGASRTGDVEPIPKQPSEADLAAWDLEDYKSMNESVREQLVAVRDLRRSIDEERKARVAKNTATRRKVESELADLRYRQRHTQQDLKAKKKRVAELEQHNAALASTLQYTQQTLKAAWGPVRESLQDRSARRSAVNTARKNQRGSSPRQDERHHTDADAAADDDAAEEEKEAALAAKDAEEVKASDAPAKADDSSAAAKAADEPASSDAKAADEGEKPAEAVVATA